MKRTLLEHHNNYRERHCAAPLEWSSAIAQSAQKWATELSDKCTMAHQKAGFGENLFQSMGRTAQPAEVVSAWYDEVSRYKYRRSPVSGTGHFTQVVWKQTKQVGCGRSSCGGGDIWVCFYDPPGNVRGLYEESVDALSCQP